MTSRRSRGSRAAITAASDRRSPRGVVGARLSSTQSPAELAVYTALFFLMALAFSTNLTVQFTLPKLLVLRLFTPVLIVLWIRRLTRGDVQPSPRMVLGAGLALAAWWILTTVFAVHPSTALHGADGRYNGLWNHLILLSIFFIVASSRYDEASIERLLKRLLAALVAVSAYAIVQYAGWDPIRWPGERSASTIGNPVILAATLGLGLPFALAFLLVSRGGDRIMWAAACVSLFAASVTTLSRGPLAATAAGVLLVIATAAWEYRFRLSRAMMAAGVIVLAAVLALGYRQVVQVRAGMPANTAETSLDRLNTYRAALQMTRDHPVVGVGLENFSVLYPRYRSAASEQLTPDVLPTMVHNGYLQAAATSGVPGLLFYLVLVLSVLAMLVKGVLRSDDRRSRLLGAAFIGSIGSYLIQDLTGWLEISLSTFFWIVLGLAVAASQAPASDEAPVPRMRALASVAATWAAMVVWLTLQTVQLVLGDRLMRETDQMSVRDRWAAVAAGLAGALSRTRDAAYLDRAGVRYAERFAAFHDPAAHRASVGHFEAAHTRNPFNSYFLIHHVGADAVALRAKVPIDTAAAERRVSLLLAMDGNNAAVHEIVARFRFAQERTADALDAIQRAKTLRPAEGRYVVFEGDLRRASNDSPRALAAYEAGIELLTADHPEWPAAQHKRMLILIEQGMLARAVEVGLELTSLPRAEAVSYTLLGHAYLRLNNLAAARDAFTAALKVAPGDDNASKALAEVNALLGK